MHFSSIQKLKAPTARQTVSKTRTSCQIYLRLSLCQSFWLTCLPLSTTLLWCHAPLNPSPHISFSIPKNRTQSQTHLAIAIAFAKFLGQIVCFVRRVHFFPSFRVLAVVFRRSLCFRCLYAKVYTYIHIYKWVCLQCHAPWPHAPPPPNRPTLQPAPIFDLLYCRLKASNFRILLYFVWSPQFGI